MLVAQTYLKFAQEPPYPLHGGVEQEIFLHGIDGQRNTISTYLLGSAAVEWVSLG